MKNKIYQFIPEHMQGLPAKIIEFEDFKDIQNELWIKNFSNHPKFKGFAVNNDMQLVAKYPNGKQYVVGKLENKIGLDSLN